MQKITLKRGILFGILFAVVIIMFLAPLCNIVSDAVEYGGYFDGGIVQSVNGNYEPITVQGGYDFLSMMLSSVRYCLISESGTLSVVSGSWAEYAAYAGGLDIAGIGELSLTAGAVMAIFIVGLVALVNFVCELFVKNSLARKIINGVTLAACFTATLLYAIGGVGFAQLAGVGGISFLPVVFIGLLIIAYVAVQIFVKERSGTEKGEQRAVHEAV